MDSLEEVEAEIERTKAALRSAGWRKRQSRGPDATALKRTVDLPALCEELLGVRLERLSESNWAGVCPLHDDRSPSFSVYRGDDGVLRCGCFAGCVPFPDERRDFGDCFDLVRAWAVLQGQDDPGFRWAIGEVVRLTGGRGPAERHLDEVLGIIDRQDLEPSEAERRKKNVRHWYREGLYGAPIEGAVEDEDEGEDDDGPVVLPPKGWTAEEE